MDGNRMSIARKNFTCRLHINPELEVIWVKKGSITIQRELDSVVLNAGEALLILPYRLHAFSPSPDVEGRVLMFPFSLAEEVYESAKAFETEKVVLDENLVRYVDSLLTKYEGGESDLIRNSVFYAFCAALLRGKMAINAGLSTDVQGVFSYVFLNINEPLSLMDIEKGTGVDRRTVSKYFREYARMPFAEFISGIKMEKARKMLLGKDSITNIAYECGFGSVRSFNRLFKRYTNCTPTEFRKNNATRNG